MKKYLFLCLLGVTLLSCKKTVPPPTKAILSLPNNNEACTNGTILSPTLVQFCLNGQPHKMWNHTNLP